MHKKSILLFFWRHIKPYKGFYLLMLLGPLVSSFYPFAYNYAIKLFLDTMASQPGATYSDFLFPIFLFLAAQVLLDIAWRVGNIAEWKAEPYVRRSLMLQSYDYIQHHSYTFFQNNFSGAVSSKLKGILDGYDKFWAEMHHGLLLRILKILVSFGSLAWVNKKLGLFIFSWGLIYVPVMYVLSKRLNGLSFTETESRHTMMGYISDRITNILSLFSFASRQRELQELDHFITTDFIPKQTKVYRYDFKIQIVAGLFYWVMFAFMLFYMIYLKINHLITLGDFALVFGIALVVVEDTYHVTISLQDFSRAMGDLKSCLTLLAIPQQSLDSKNAYPLVIRHPSIEFKNVSFGYDNKSKVFENLHLVIQPGEKIGLVGHSGAGKSSLINLLLRYFESTEGEILIDGHNIQKITQDSLRANIAVIPQDTLLFHRTLMENIRYGKPDASNEEVIKASKKAHIHDFIMALPEQYQSYVGERGIKLSGGQRQRIAIARAILKDAPILILDEATSSLDNETEKLIQESLDFLIESQGKTVIAIAHRTSTLKHMHRILVLDEGRIVKDGTYDDLMAT